MRGKKRLKNRKTMKPTKLSKAFCRCIKSVRKTVKLRPGQKKTKSAKEAAAIAICTKSVLQTRNKTLKRFGCGKKPILQTQKLL
jgi:hypothetical protein